MTAKRKNGRIFAVGILFVIIAFALWARLFQIQYLRCEQYRSIAKQQMVTTETIQPVRGSIFDRHGRPLALSVRMSSVYLRPQDVTEPGRVVAVASKVLGLSKRQVRRYLRSGKSFVWLKRSCVLNEEAKERITAVSGLGVDLEQGRVYPFGSLAAKVVGFVGVDNCGMAGVEASLNDVLCGVPGKARLVKNGQYRADRYYRFVETQPKNGSHVYLTIDATIQEIAEDRLLRAVAESGARFGAVVIVKADTGEILALAEYPAPTSRHPSQLADSLWTIRSVSHVYEPGSTFKLIASAALLDSRVVERTDTFDAENGRANVGVAVIADPHPHGWITFEEAFAYSSNIVTYKASSLIDAHDFYRYIRLFGFGEKTGVELNGESAGSFAKVDDWSLRTKGTIAFGQEIAVTPLQMIAAFSVAPNDGALVLPRLVRGVVDEATGDVQRMKTVKVRRVVRKGTARTMMEFCRRAVVDGTGQLAAVDFMDVSGKTGTAQKASAHGGYIRGKYVSSFVGFAPHDDPRFVCLVLLDEPKYESRYGGVSSAPVFSDLCRAVANATGVFDGRLTTITVPRPTESRDDYTTPNFIRMERAAALECARNWGCNVLCQGDEGRVVAQVPGPGVSMDKDDVIRLAVAPSSQFRKSRVTTPDLRGLPVRKAKAVAAQFGLECKLVGSGVVKSQKPGPGRQTRQQQVTLYCEAAGGTGRGRGGGS